ncbi:MAG: HK97 family phage prohead protease [Gemmobacter sp.]
MLCGGVLGAVETRAAAGGAVRLVGRFPYGIAAELAPGRAEIIAPGAFAPRIDAGDNILLLAGHDSNRPLASRRAGTLALRQTADALEVEAVLDGHITRTSWAADFLSAHAAGLVRGLSPGFVVRQGGERIERRAGGLLRTVTAADLYELSAVTEPAYAEAAVEARRWYPPAADPAHGPIRAMARWRA